MKNNKLLFVLLTSVLLLSSCQKKKDEPSESNSTSSEQSETSESQESTESQTTPKELNKEFLLKAKDKTMKCYNESSLKITLDDYFVDSEVSNSVHKFKYRNDYEEKLLDKNLLFIYEQKDGSWVKYATTIGVEYGIEVAGFNDLMNLGEEYSNFDIDSFAYEYDTATCYDEYYGAEYFFKVDLESGYIISFGYSDDTPIKLSDFGKITVTLPDAQSFLLDDRFYSILSYDARISEIDFSLPMANGETKEYTFYNDRLHMMVKGNEKPSYIERQNRIGSTKIINRIDPVDGFDFYVKYLNISTISDQDAMSFLMAEKVFMDYIATFNESNYVVLENSCHTGVILKTSIFLHDAKLYFNEYLELYKIIFETQEQEYEMNITRIEDGEKPVIPGYSFYEDTMMALISNNVNNIPSYKMELDEFIDSEDYYVKLEIKSTEVTGNAFAINYYEDTRYLDVDLQFKDGRKFAVDGKVELSDDGIKYFFSEIDENEYEEVTKDAYCEIYDAFKKCIRYDLFDIDGAMVSAKNVRPIDRGIIIDGEYEDGSHNYQITYTVDEDDSYIASIDYVLLDNSTLEVIDEVHVTYLLSLAIDSIVDA